MPEKNRPHARRIHVRETAMFLGTRCVRITVIRSQQISCAVEGCWNPFVPPAKVYCFSALVKVGWVRCRMGPVQSINLLDTAMCIHARYFGLALLVATAAGTGCRRSGPPFSPKESLSKLQVASSFR